MASVCGSLRHGFEGGGWDRGSVNDGFAGSVEVAEKATMVGISTGDDDERFEERRRRRRAGDPRLSPEARELLRRLTTGDLVEEFQAALDAVSDADPLLGGGLDADD
jgi:hypothetical protein